MDTESVRATLLKLPHVVETMQWGDNLVYWVGDKAVGGKMFALVNLDQVGQGSGPAKVMSIWVGPERFAELVEREGVVPAPYMARIFWVALEDWNALPSGELISLLKDAREGTYQKLPQRTKGVLAMPAKELGKLVVERRKLLAAKTASERAAKETTATDKKSSAKPPVSKRRSSST